MKKTGRKQVTKFRLGEEYLYEPNHSTGPIYLTFVEHLGRERCLLFSSEFPSVDYDVRQDSLRPASQDVPRPKVTEKILAFRGKDKKKKQAYEILMLRRDPQS